VEVRFDQAMDALSFRQQTFQLTWSGGDGSFNEGNEVTLQTLTLRLTSSRVAELDLTGLPPLPEDLYRLTLVGTGTPAILSAAGEALDGEYSGGFPSGNGVAGGDFRIFFQTSTAVLSMTPAPGSVLTSAPSRIEVETSPDVDPATVDATTFRLLGSGGDGDFHDGDEIEIAPASVSRIAAGRFRFDLGATVLAPDDYQVILAGAGSGMALRFDGVDDLATIPGSAAFAPGSGSWCVECWVSLDDPAAASAMVSCADGNLVNGWLLGQDGSFRFSLSGASGTRSAAGGGTPGALVWYHVAGVYDQALGETYLYVDGALAATDLAGSAGAVTPSADLLLGRHFGTLLSGRIDEVRLWSIARSPEALRRDSRRTLMGSESGLAGYWKLNETSGQGFADASPLANTGVLGSDGGVAADDPVRVASSAWPQVMDLDGHPLDGKFRGSFPSGIGSPGGDFMATFTVR
jgi:hypothetical protein